MPLSRLLGPRSLVEWIAVSLCFVIPAPKWEARGFQEFILSKLYQALWKGVGLSRDPPSWRYCFIQWNSSNIRGIEFHFTRFVLTNLQNPLCYLASLQQPLQAACHISPIFQPPYQRLQLPWHSVDLLYSYSSDLCDSDVARNGRTVWQLIFIRSAVV